MLGGLTEGEVGGLFGGIMGGDVGLVVGEFVGAKDVSIGETLGGKVMCWVLGDALGRGGWHPSAR